MERILSGSLAAQLPEIVTYGVTREESERFRLPCGGTLQLVAEPVRSATALNQMLSEMEAGRIIARTLDLASGHSEIRPVIADQELQFDGVVLTTVHGPRWRLLIIGANQVSSYLAPMAVALDYRVTVCDPREAYALSWEVAGINVTPGMPDDVIIAIAPDPRTAIVCVTHDPKLDDMALLEALKSKAFYVGALGSRSNNDLRRERLALLDMTPEEINRLHGPVGLAIGSKTPPEIAISIVAEMTAVRHGALRKNNSGTWTSIAESAT